MVKITKVYTKTGDKGETSLAAGKRTPKTSARIEVIGCIDELNAALGIAVALFEQVPALLLLRGQLIRIQNTLYDLGACLAVLSENRHSDTPKIDTNDITTLELEIDRMNSSLTRLNSFVLPGGGVISAQLHVVRTVCRRAELALLRLAATETVGDNNKSYINRLSDWFFVAARFVAQQTGNKEILWQPGKRDFSA